MRTILIYEIPSHLQDILKPISKNTPLHVSQRLSWRPMACGVDSKKPAHGGPFGEGLR